MPSTTVTKTPLNKDVQRKMEAYYEMRIAHWQNDGVSAEGARILAFANLQVAVDEMIERAKRNVEARKEAV
jgi:hypothetical protein